MIWWAISLALPSIVEAYLDRDGEYASGKRKDTLWLLIAAVLLSASLWLLSDVPPWKTAALILGWRVFLFDYLVTYLLIKNGVIVGHWFDYTGQTSHWDRLISKVNPWVRLAVRVIFFGIALTWFIT